MAAARSQLRSLLEKTALHREVLERHALYGELTSLPRVRCFLEHHVFAVWDFMSLLKGLQRHLTRVQTPWLPVGDARIRRLINEIVLGEESDQLPGGRVCSHFELYLEAMREAGTDVSTVLAFVDGLRRHLPVATALLVSKAPPASRAFVTQTLEVVKADQPHVLAAVFAVGRERMIPPMFGQIVQVLAESHPQELQVFQLYLQRHIALDRGEHGPAALEMLEGLCADDSAKWGEATHAATCALESRRHLWDEVRARLVPLR